MENKIRLLPEIVANQIAAGEVVDNPSSVVKEMMENAIDAGAKSVTVNFRNAGLELIQIIDDGCGMSPMDARMAFDRHATSKIKSFEDVYRLQTFGFRGEALASIAAVAQVELRTRQAEDEVGTVTIVNGGEFVSQTPTMCPVGSQFFVRNLFYTAPARRKFNGDRSRMVTDIKKEFRRVALCNPQVRCELMSNDMPIITLSAGTLSERIIDVVGRHIKTNLLEVDVDTTIVKVKGYVGRPSAAKQKNAEQYLFVNGRYFRSPQLYRSIMRAYEKLIPENCSPSYFLYLTVDPERVDVNVSPHKTEVKFADSEDVNQIVTAAVRSTLAKSGSLGMMEFEKPEVEIPVLESGHTFYSEPAVASIEGYNPFSEGYADAAELNEKDSFDVMNDSKPSSVSRVSSTTNYKDIPARFNPSDMGIEQRSVESALRDVPWSNISLESEFNQPIASPIIESQVEYVDIPSSGFDLSNLAGEEGEESSFEYVASSFQQEITHDQALSFEEVLPLTGGYAVAMAEARSMIVDLRRAKERVLYDGYMAMLSCGSCPCQQLLFAETLILQMEDYDLLSENEVEFSALGFDLELQGEGKVELRGIPSSVKGEQADKLIYELLRELESNADLGRHLHSRMAQVMARRGSAISSRSLSKAEVMELLGRLCECDNYSFSPSGKPIMVELTQEDIKAKLS
ncbi:MAG: DNA mismatch repair endonuclease MutL [Alistipes sp.]|nr:DNA mismatch repair endonuclease MutL [Alistipes sp.]